MRSTNVRSFYDTSVLVYTDDQRYPEKLNRSIELFDAALRNAAGVVSTQVLQEYFVTITRKLNVTAEVAQRKVEVIAELDVVHIDVPIILRAIELHRLHQLSFWDALIVQAAIQARCTRLYTEDLQHGHRIQGVEIVNPFV
ncbi:MAG: PIN domain-containing protein [Chloroflexota bacterium]